MKKILHSKIIGQGEPLVILHGFLGMSDNWKTLGSRYADNGFQTHLPDQRNHGKSFWSAAFNFKVLADDLKSYAEHHNLQSFHLIGHSMGGKTAMKFACAYPGAVRTLVVADISPKYYPPHHSDILNALRDLDLESITSRTEADEMLGEQLSNPGIRQFLLKNLYWESREKLALRLNLSVLQGVEEEIGKSLSPTDRYEEPCLFLRGDQSDYILEADLPKIQEHFPQAILQTIADAGHWLHAEQPDVFLEKTLDFIRKT